MKYQFIHQYRFCFPVKKMCHILSVSGSGYYSWVDRSKSRRTSENQEILKEIKMIHTKHKSRYGSPRMHQDLLDKGYSCSENRVARIMAANDIRAIFKKKFFITTNSRHLFPVAPNILNRNFHADKPNKKWVSDITYIRVNQRWLFLCVIIDLYSRKVVGWSMDTNLRASLVTDAFLMATINRQPKPGLIFHSDRGIQYASKECRNLLSLYGIIQSMSGKGDCWDNACAETFFKTLKMELIRNQNFKSMQNARTDIFEYIEAYYNTERRHSKLGYKSPNAFEEQKI